MITIRQAWTLSSAAGTGTAVNARGYSLEHTFYYTAGSGASSGVVTIRSGAESTGPFADVPGTSTTVSTSGANIVTFTGPLEWIQPFSSNVTGTIEVLLLGHDGQ